MTEPAAPLRSLVRAVEETQPLAPEWRAAFLATQRHLFIPDTVWLRDPDATTVHDLVPLHRAAAPDRWLELAYADDSIVTQVDDGRATGPDGAGYAVSSSASQPSVVAMMLAAAGFEDGMTVCEIGTGTGYNAALLGCRLGDRNVTTIEIDPELASRARNALGRAGHQIAVVTGDGALGHPPRAPYDRVLATCAVHRVPYRWVAQSSPGGRIVTPWGTSYFNGGLLSLSVDSDGTAHGRLTDTAAFMWIRDQRLPRVTVGECVHHEEDATTTYTDLHPSRVIGEQSAAVAIGLQVPNCKTVYSPAGDGSGEYTLWLLDQVSRSWASVDYQPGATAHRVDQLGPRLLWNEVDAAYRRWREVGSPGTGQWHFTITPDGQRVALAESGRADRRAWG